jgi:hypothetical protein
VDLLWTDELRPFFFSDFRLLPDQLKGTRLCVWWGRHQDLGYYPFGSVEFNATWCITFVVVTLYELLAQSQDAKYALFLGARPLRLRHRGPPSSEISQLSQYPKLREIWDFVRCAEDHTARNGFGFDTVQVAKVAMRRRIITTSSDSGW